MTQSFDPWLWGPLAACAVLAVVSFAMAWRQRRVRCAGAGRAPRDHR